MKIEVKGEGKFLAYCSSAPKRSYVNGGEVEYKSSGNGKVEVDVPWYQECGGISNITFVF